jgi:hypothetical protein
VRELQAVTDSSPLHEHLSKIGDHALKLGDRHTADAVVEGKRLRFGTLDDGTRTFSVRTDEAVLGGWAEGPDGHWRPWADPARTSLTLHDGIILAERAVWSDPA